MCLNIEYSTQHFVQQNIHAHVRDEEKKKWNREYVIIIFTSNMCGVWRVESKKKAAELLHENPLKAEVNFIKQSSYFSHY